jgi:hypothetical protein
MLQGKNQNLMIFLMKGRGLTAKVLRGKKLFRNELKNFILN